MEELKYKSLDIYSEGTIREILEANDLERLIILPLSVGMHYPDWKYSQDLCLKLANHDDWRVRANALRGLEYIARTKGKLQKYLLKPILLKFLKSEERDKLDIIHITERINTFLGWEIGKNEIKRLRNKSK